MRGRNFDNSKLKKRGPKVADNGGGSGFCIKTSTVGPNDLIFFPVKLELNPDLMVEISTGNTSEISTGFPSKSAILDIFEAIFPDFVAEIISTCKTFFQ